MVCTTTSDIKGELKDNYAITHWLGAVAVRWGVIYYTAQVISSINFKMTQRLGNNGLRVRSWPLDDNYVKKL